MGLFGKILGGSPPKKPTDDILLLFAMMLMSNVDGYLEGAEIATLEAFINTLPEFKDADFTAQMAAARKLRARFETSDEAVEVLAQIESEHVRRKAFLLAADIAMSSGDVDADEQRLLDAMRRVLAIDDALAGKVLEVLGLKYAK